MRTMKGILGTALVAGIAALLTVSAASALATPGQHHHGNKGHHNSKGHHKGHAQVTLIEASLAPSLTTDPTFHGVGPGSAPWVLAHGIVRINSHGLNLHVHGLLIPKVGVGPVKTINASLYCGADTNTTAAAISKQVPLSSKGDAVIEDRSFTMPATCLAPVVLVNPNGLSGAYIAVSGARP